MLMAWHCCETSRASLSTLGSCLIKGKVEGNVGSSSSFQNGCAWFILWISQVLLGSHCFQQPILLSFSPTLSHDLSINRRLWRTLQGLPRMAGRCRHCLEGPRNVESLLPLAIVSLASLDTLPLWGRSYSDPSAAPLSQQVSGSFYFPLLRSLAAFTHWYVFIRAFHARLCVSVLNNRISRVAVTAARRRRRCRCGTWLWVSSLLFPQEILNYAIALLLSQPVRCS